MNVCVCVCAVGGHYEGCTVCYGCVALLRFNDCVIVVRSHGNSWRHLHLV